MNKNQILDGKEHINIYSKGQTELGRFLSNFAYSPIETEDGNFNAIEGYWYWLSSKDDKLRTMDGWEAKKYGRYVGAKDWLEDAEFKRKIKSAIRIKVMSNPKMMEEMKASSLPFTHYYVYGDTTVRVSSADWIVTFIENIRKELKENNEYVRKKD